MNECNIYASLVIDPNDYKKWIGEGKYWEKRGRFQLDFLIKLGLKPHHTLLDVGCGPLRGGIHFINYLNIGNYWGIDFNEGFIEIAKTIQTDKRPNLQLITDFNYNTSFDYILFWSVLNHCEQKDKIKHLSEAPKKLKKNGKICISHAGWFFYNRDDYHTDLCVTKIQKPDNLPEWSENHIFPFCILTHPLKRFL